MLARHNFAHSMLNGMGELNETAKKYNLQTFLPAVDPLVFMRSQCPDSEARSNLAIIARTSGPRH